MNQLYVGASRVSIDPAPEMYPMPTGFDVVDARYNTCHVRAIALKSGEESALLMTFELSDMPTVEGLTAEVSAASGIPEDRIIISWTHNHTSPRDYNVNNYGRAPDPEDVAAKRLAYKTIELNAAKQAAAEAAASMRPAKVGFGKTNSYINVNRDYNSLGGYWIEAPNFNGYSDRTLAMVKFVDNDGKLIAALLNHGTHNVCGMDTPDRDGKTKTSSNFSGIACEFLEKYYGEETVVMWTAGCAGNQDPIFSHGLQLEYPDGYVSTVGMPDGTGWIQMECIGRLHAVDALKGLNSISRYTAEAEIVHREKTLLLPAQKRKKTPDGRWINPRMGGHGFRNEEKVPYGHPPALPDTDAICEPDTEHPVEMKLHLLKLGDIALIYTNGEMYAELGSLIKARSPLANTVVVTYSVAPSTSYIVDASSAHHKVFQAFGAVAPGKSDEIILAGTRDLIASAI